jgi:hypothetical protein
MRFCDIRAGLLVFAAIVNFCRCAVRLVCVAGLSYPVNSGKNWPERHRFGEKLSKRTVAAKKPLYNFCQTFYYAVHRGEMAEWFNAPVLKTGEG